MRLLVTTQVVDIEDPVLGFFHGWLKEFSKHFESIEVVCLREGVHALPSNVHVHSLGKERGVSRLGYIVAWFRYLYRLRGRYDALFSHMNPHYIVLGGWYLRFNGIPMYLWRNHARMNVLTRVAALFARKVFYTSPHACTRVFRHSVQMPVGIDANCFFDTNEGNRIKNSVLFLGRISPVKKPELFLEASKELPSYTIAVYGDEPSGNTGYRSRLIESAPGHVSFYSAVKNSETVSLYRRFECYVNLTPPGSMDKTVIEAALCGALVVTTNDSFSATLPKESFPENATPKKVAECIERILALPEAKKESIRVSQRRRAIADHSLQGLGEKLFYEITM